MKMIDFTCESTTKIIFYRKQLKWICRTPKNSNCRIEKKRTFFFFNSIFEISQNGGCEDEQKKVFPWRQDCEPTNTEGMAT